MAAKIILTGNIGGKITTNISEQQKPEKPYCYFNVADTQGDKTIWYNIKAYGNDALYVNKFLGQGSKVVIVGRLEFDDYNNKEVKIVSAYSIEGYSIKKATEEATGTQGGRNIENELPF